MSNWTNATVTAKGYALQAKLLLSDSLVITKVVAGAGRVSPVQLGNQTTVIEEKQTLSVDALSYDANGNAIIKVTLNNKSLTSGYTCNQVGIYASDPDEGEILYAIAQELNKGEDIPSITEQPNGYYCSWVFSLTFSNSSNISVTIDPANALTKEAADSFYVNKDAHPHKLKSIAGGSGNTIEDDDSFVFGGDRNTVHGKYTGVIASDDCTFDETDSERSVAISCMHTTVGGWYSAAIACEGSYASSELRTKVLGEFCAAIASYNTSVKGRNNAAIASASCEIPEDVEGSLVSGTNLKAKSNQIVFGKNNKEVEGPKNSEEQSADSSIFLIGSGVSRTPANAFRVSSAGKCYGSAAFVGSGADFPEFEEWADGNPDNEDRRGLFVALEGDKIVLASSEKDHIIGVVSAMGAFIANGASENWHGMYMKDVFGENLTQQVDVPEKIIEKKVIEQDAEGKEVIRTIEEVIPAQTVTQFVVNPDYNPDEEYIGREFRKEWAPIGKLGQVIVVDDGTCTVGGYCKPSANGIGTAGEYGYYVRKRIDSTHIKVEISPGAFNK